MNVIVIPGNPTSLKRHRTCLIAGKMRQYNSQSKQMQATKMIMHSQRKCETFKSALQVQIKFYFYRPRKLKNYTEEQLAQEKHTQKPDIDNLIKYVLDCGNGVLWDDDCLIYRMGMTQKFWSHHPRTEIIYGL